MQTTIETEIPKSVKWPSLLVSVIFHPVFIPLYVAGYLLFMHPLAFPGFSMAEKRQVMLITALNLVFFPLLTVFLLKALGFIDSLHLRTAKDRIIPYIASGIFYFWAYTVFNKQSRYPDEYTAFVLGGFLAVSAALIINIYLKLSMHMLAMGGWLGLFVKLAWDGNLGMAWPLALVCILCGLVASARMMVSAHTDRELWVGLCTGILAQWVAAAFVQAF